MGLYAAAAEFECVRTFISTFWREHWSGVRRTCRIGSSAPGFIIGLTQL